MKICIAQIRPIKGDVLANIDKHASIVIHANKLEASAVFFPELSLTGYEPELAKDLAMSLDEPGIEIFQKISNTLKISIGMGMPTKTGSGIQISMIIFQPDKPRQSYSKQQLHQDELPYFVKGEKQILVTVGNKKIAPAICYESLQADHSEHAYKLGADVYLASVAKSQNGIDQAMQYFPVIARKYSMPVLMSNCIGFCDNFLSAGQSAVWNKKGELAGNLDSNNEGLLIFDTNTEKVTMWSL